MSTVIHSASDIFLRDMKLVLIFARLKYTYVCIWCSDLKASVFSLFIFCILILSGSREIMVHISMKVLTLPIESAMHVF